MEESIWGCAVIILVIISVSYLYLLAKGKIK